MIYQAADHRNPADIESTWLNLLESTHRKIVDQGDKAKEMPYEAVVQVVRDMAARLNLSETTFSPTLLVPMLERYAFEHQRGVGESTWVMDLFIDVKIPYETLISVLETMFYNDEAPFEGRNRRYIAKEMLYVIRKWYETCLLGNMRLFGGGDNAATITQTLEMLMKNGLDQNEVNDAKELQVKISRNFR
jgi:nuclear pore complex protein Nup155